MICAKSGCVLTRQCSHLSLHGFGRHQIVWTPCACSNKVAHPCVRYFAGAFGRMTSADGLNTLLLPCQDKLPLIDALAKAWEKCLRTIEVLGTPWHHFSPTRLSWCSCWQVSCSAISRSFASCRSSGRTSWLTMPMWRCSADDLGLIHSCCFGRNEEPAQANLVRP